MFHLKKIAWIDALEISRDLGGKNSHVSNPIVLDINVHIWRVFVSVRNEFNQSSVVYFDIAKATYKKISKARVLINIENYANTFFADGIGLGDYFCVNNKTTFGFMAWKQHKTKHWTGEIGTFNLNNQLDKIVAVNALPQLKIGVDANISLSYPGYLYENGLLHIWYGSTLTWDAGNSDMHHVIKHLTIDSQGHRTYHGQCIPSSLTGFQAFSRPIVRPFGNRYVMVLSSRKAKLNYTIKFFQSNDLANWQCVESQIEPRQAEQDDEMICYPYLMTEGGNFYLWYNGNSYGKTGLGVAKLAL